MEIAILAFEHITALDAVGPHEVLDKLPGAKVRWVGLQEGPVTADGGLQLLVQAPMEDVPRPDVIVVPGGFGTRALMDNERVHTWLQKAHPHTRFTTSVCTGSLVLAAAGLLKGLSGTCHWAYRDVLTKFGAEPSAQRVVEQGRVLTAAGVSAGIDMALTLAARLMGPDVAMGIQLAIEYDPQPPFDAGAPDKAPPHVLEMVSKLEKPDSYPTRQ